VSAKHAVIACDVAGAETPDEYKVTITDFSRHGVFVNGEKIEPGAPAPLAPDDVVTLPFGLEYRFELPRDAPRPAPAPRDGKDGKKAQKTPGSKKKTAGTPGGAKRAAARGKTTSPRSALKMETQKRPRIGKRRRRARLRRRFGFAEQARRADARRAGSGEEAGDRQRRAPRAAGTRREGD